MCDDGNPVRARRANTVEVPATGCAPKSNVAAASTWAFEIQWIQDWQTAAGGGLSGYMFTQDGNKKWVEITPTSPTLPAFQAQVTIVAGDVYGPYGTLLVASATCPVEGKPTWTPPVLLAADASADPELVDA